MNPEFFGSRSRPLFGVFTPAPDPVPDRAVLLLAPFLQEVLRAHRSIRRLTEMLAAHGWDSLRFDYFGTGDSGGVSTDLTVESAVRDALVALEELEELTGARRFELIGFRAGCAVAAEVARRRGDGVERLVLWDPPVGPADDWRTRAQATLLGQPGDPVEIDGFVWSRETAACLAELGDSALVTPVPAQLVASTRESEALETLVRAVREAGADVQLEVHPAPPSWSDHDGVGVGALPTAVLDRISSWRR